MKKILIVFLLSFILFTFSCKKQEESSYVKTTGNGNTDIVDSTGTGETNSPKKIVIGYVDLYGYNTIKQKEDLVNEVCKKYNINIVFKDISDGLLNKDDEDYITKKNDFFIDPSKVFRHIDYVRELENKEDYPQIIISNMENLIYDHVYLKEKESIDYNDYFVSLYNLNTKEGYLNNFDDIKSLYSDIVIHNNVYMTCFKNMNENNMLVYDKAEIARNGLEDPLTLFYKGEWTLEKYYEYNAKCRYIQKSNFDSYDNICGNLGASGYLTCDISNYNKQTVSEYASFLNEYGVKLVKGSQAKFTAPLSGDFNPETEGIVPYPSNNAVIKPIFEPYGKFTEPISDFELDGKKIYGLDLSEANYYNVNTWLYGFVIPNYNNTDEENMFLLKIAEELSNINIYCSPKYDVYQKLKNLDNNNMMTRLYEIMSENMRYDRIMMYYHAKFNGFKKHWHHPIYYVQRGEINQDDLIRYIYSFREDVLKWYGDLFA